MSHMSRTHSALTIQSATRAHHARALLLQLRTSPRELAQGMWREGAATHCNNTATHCNTLQHTEPLLANSPNVCVTLVVAMCCRVLQCCWFAGGSHCMLYNTAAHWSTLQQHTAKYCNTLQHTAITLQHTCNTLQHAATRCNTLQHTAAPCSATPCNTRGTYMILLTHLQHTVTPCNSRATCIYTPSLPSCSRSRTHELSINA